MATFSFIHLSDPHIGEPCNRSPITDFGSGERHTIFGTHDSVQAKGVVRLVRSLVQAEDVSGVVVTGDLAATGEPDDLLAAREFLVGNPRDPRQRSLKAAAQGRPLMLLPGNHDRYRLRIGVPGGSDFDRRFRREWRVRRSAQLLGVFRRGDSGVALIAADFSLGRKDWTRGASALGQGSVGFRALRSLTELTRAVRMMDGNVGVIWCVHFAPCFEGIASSLALEGDDRLLRAAEAARVDVILCGHTHERRCPYPMGAEGHVLCAGTCCAYRGLTHSAMLVGVSVSAGRAKLSSVKTYGWDKKSYCFLPQNGCPTDAATCTWKTPH